MFYKNDNETIDNQTRKKLRHNQVGGGDHLLSDQQLLEIENRGQPIMSLHPGFKRACSMVDLPEVPAKRPRVLGPKLSARFGTLTSSLVARKGIHRPTHTMGNWLGKGVVTNSPDHTKKPRCDGLNSPSEHGTLNHDASSLSRF